jgi:hypothetical protein
VAPEQEADPDASKGGKSAQATIIGDTPGKKVTYDAGQCNKDEEYAGTANGGFSQTRVGFRAPQLQLPKSILWEPPRMGMRRPLAPQTPHEAKAEPPAARIAWGSKEDKSSKEKPSPPKNADTF